MSQVRKFVTNADTFKFGFKGLFHRFSNKEFETSDNVLADYLSTLDQVKEVTEKIEIVVETSPQSAPTEDELKAQEKARLKELKAQEKVKKAESEGKK